MKNSTILLIALFIISILNLILINGISSLKKQQREELLKHEAIEKAIEGQFLQTLEIGMKKISIPELENNNLPLFCYYASDIHCNSCVDSAFNLFSQFIKFHTEIKPALFANYKNKQDLDIFIRQHKYDGLIVETHSKLIEKSNQPMFFIYHPQKLIGTDFFIPNKNNQEFTKKYLTMLYSKYCMQKNVENNRNK